MKGLFVLLLIIISGFSALVAQSSDKKEKMQNDSILYQNIYEFSKQNRFNKLLYDLIFKKPQQETKDSVQKSSSVYNHKDFEKKIIRNINIINQAPFDIDENDKVVQKNISKTGNLLHVNTRSFVIKNLLLFNENEKFDSILILESERLLRSRRYIEKSAIFGMDVENSKDSVDVIVIVKDRFSIYPEGEISSSRFGIGLKEINLFGMGHQAHAYYSWNYQSEIYNYQYDYKIPNILNSYITAGIVYSRNEFEKDELKHFYVERPFYSALAKWAGGLSFLQQSQKHDVYLPNTDSYINLRFKYNVADVWAAYAFDLNSQNPIKARTRKLVLSARYYHIDYFEKPKQEYDPMNIYLTENLYLLGLGISKRNYQKDTHLFRFGFIEDVPTGYNYSLIGGVQNKNEKNRLYLAAKLSMGKYFKLGYFGTTIEYGSFFDDFDVKEGVFSAEVNYFTPLIEIGGWKFRQFVKPQYMLGINRLATDRLSLDNYYGIYGFNSRGMNGTQKMVFNFQTQIFTTWNLWGFKLAPYFIYSMGMLGNNETGFRKSKAYSLFGLGFLIRNDHLLFNSFEVSVSFYPHIPERGFDIFKFNSYEASDFSLRDFDIKKPEKIVYR